MVHTKLHKNICSKASKISDWFCDKTTHLEYPIYSSYDIRDAGYKVTNVDANIFPAGFNNICPTDKETATGLFSGYLDKHYGKNLKRIMLVTEEHTHNPYYWENVISIRAHLEGAGKQVLLAVPRRLDHPLKLTSATGLQVEVHSAYEDSSVARDFKPDLIISNNDFSNAHDEWASSVTLPMNPPRELGWYQRKKSRYFKIYNELVNEFSDLVGFDPFLMNVKTEIFENFDLAEEASRNLLATKVDQMLAELKEDYKRRQIDAEPFLFVKNNSGTYGLAVIRVGSGEEIKEWSYKSRKKMKAAKGGRDVEEVIIQEGIPSRVQSDGATAEPVIYMVGCELAGGFLRAHSEKSATENLNSPGAVYKRLCVSDLNISIEGSPLENVYGWTARLGMLAIAIEGQEMGVEYQGYHLGPC
jgi:glutamate--cysteine ligase